MGILDAYAPAASGNYYMVDRGCTVLFQLYREYAQSLTAATVAMGTFRVEKMVC